MTQTDARAQEVAAQVASGRIFLAGAGSPHRLPDGGEAGGAGPGGAAQGPARAANRVSASPPMSWPAGPP